MANPFFEALTGKSKNFPEEVCFDLHGIAGHEKRLTFSHVHDRISSTAQMYIENGVAKGDIVLIFAQHSEGMLLAFFGAQWMGAVPAFMPPPTIKQDVSAWAKGHKRLIDRIQPHLVVSEPSSLEHVKALGVDVIVSTDEIEVFQTPKRPTAVPVDLDNIAFLQHSSGTTGLKKGVTVTYRQLLSQLDVYGDAIGIDDTSNVISWLPIYHDMGLVAATLLPMRKGVPVRLIDTFAWLSNPGVLISLLEKHPNAYCWLPNFAFNYLAKRARLDLSENALSGVRAVINCSEPCKQDDMHAFETRFGPHGLPANAVQICYAAAEYVFAIAQTPRRAPITGLLVDAHILESERRVVVAHEATDRSKVIMPVGMPIEGVDIRIGDNLQDGNVGEVVIRGPSMCGGYFRNEETTKRKFVDGWYQTGDLGFKYEGVLYITGRVDDLIIVRGKNLYAHDIEQLASTIPGVKPGRTTAFGVDDASGTQQLILAVEATGEVAVRALKAEIIGRINDSFGIAPAHVVAVRANSLVKTTSGKISRSENRKNYLTRSMDLAELDFEGSRL
ncbi:AMP-binding protein [Ensifer sesbaniae]|uniref:AMP-binding protein n=1 Tax=Ensifer sesbaniae TaxID=1214071 RepID=UPI00156961F1|nr:AMP-binding protein [Ensifer sesbaniae]NRQ14609.1 Long-chain-fatty-acid--[acyl-carrier-protein] ligase MbtM [Ensifer sesbaniae]